MQPSSTADQVAAVILAHNRRDHVLKVIQAVKAQSCRPCRIVVVDNGSEDGTAAALAAAHPDITCIPLDENRGVGAGHNAGWRAALADPTIGYIWAVEHDCIPHRTCLAELLAAHHALWPPGERSGIVIPYQENPATLSAQPHIALRGLRWIRLQALPPSAPPQPRPRLTFNGALMPVDLLAEVGLLDEAFFVYCEDLDFSLRCHQHARPIILVPAARVDHDLFRDSLHWSIGRWVILGPGRAGRLRVYYGFRNHLVLTLRTSRRPSLAVLRHLIAYLLLQLWDLCMATDRRRRLALRTLALRDGLAQRLGRIEHPLLTDTSAPFSTDQKVHPS